MNSIRNRIATLATIAFVGACQTTDDGKNHRTTTGQNLGAGEWERVSMDHGNLDIGLSEIRRLTVRRLDLSGRTVFTHSLNDRPFFDDFGEFLNRRFFVETETLNLYGTYAPRSPEILRRHVENWGWGEPISTDNLDVRRASLFANEAAESYVGTFWFNEWACVAFDGIFGRLDYDRSYNETSKSIFNGWYCLRGDLTIADVENHAFRILSKVTFKQPDEPFTLKSTAPRVDEDTADS